MRTKQAIQLALIGGALGVLTSGSLAETVAETLEQGVQLQQVAGDYDAAIQHYETVLKHERKWKKLAAEARFRLAECYVAKGDTSKARQQVDALRGDYPADNRWVTKAVGMIPVESHFSGAPWQDGQVFFYEVQMKNGKKVGHFLLAQRKLVDGPNPEWESYLVRTAGNNSLSRTRFAEDGYQMLDSRWYLRGMGDVAVSFEKGGMVRLSNAETGDETDHYDHAAGKYSKMPVYENEQMVQLLRALDQKIGTKQKTVLIASLNGARPIEFDLEVTAHEEVDVPAGKFDCAKIETNLKQTFYISREADRRIIKIDMGPAAVKLAETHAWNPDAARPVKAKHLACSFEVPGKMLSMPPVDNKDVYRVQLWSSDFAGRDTMVEINWTKSLIEKVEHDEPSISSRALAESTNETVAKSHDEWAIDEDSWTEIDVDGVEGVTLIATGRDGEIALNMFQVFAVGEEKALTVRVSYAGPDLDKARARVLELVKSFKWEK